MPAFRSRTCAAAVGAVLVLAGSAGCGGDSGDAENIAVIDLSPDQVASVTFTAAGRTATFQGRDGGFDPAQGASREFATQLTTVADRVFPLNSYRILTEADAAEPTYGLVSATAGTRAKECGAGCSVEVVSDSGRTWRLAVGGRSFNGAGFYASVAGDPRIYLLIAQSVGDIITFATGAKFEFPLSAEVANVDKVLGAIGTDAEKAENSAANYHPFLRQVLAAEADQAAAKAGKPGGNLTRTATSTQDQAGAKPGRPVSGGVGSALPGSSGSGSGGSGSIGSSSSGSGSGPAPTDTTGTGR